MFLYLDIETIPAQPPAIREAVAKTVKPPAAMKKADTIAAWERDQRGDAIMEAIAKTSLDGAYGHVCCVGWAWDDGRPNSFVIEDVKAEAAMLRDFFDALLSHTQVNLGFPVIVGHNVVDFDIRFLWQRAIVLGVVMPGFFPRDPKPWGDDTLDTMTAFAGARNTIGMDRLCDALGIEGKGDIDGSMVAGLWSDGKFQTIADYCKADVERTRLIHRRMMVAFGEAA